MITCNDTRICIGNGEARFVRKYLRAKIGSLIGFASVLNGILKEIADCIYGIWYYSAVPLYRG